MPSTTWEPCSGEDVANGRAGARSGQGATPGTRQDAPLPPTQPCRRRSRRPRRADGHAGQRRGGGPSRATVVLDGEVGSWLRSGVHVIPQRTGPFADRLEGAIEDAFAAFPAPILLVGMDTPQMAPGHLTTAAETLLKGDTDTILGRADDGGFWIIGIRQPVAGLCNGVPMSTATTGTRQLAQLSALGLRCIEVNPMRDVDVMEDALAVAAAAPRSRFAAVLRSCGAIPSLKAAGRRCLVPLSPHVPG